MNVALLQHSLELSLNVRKTVQIIFYIYLFIFHLFTHLFIYLLGVLRCTGNIYGARISASVFPSF